MVAIPYSEVRAQRSWVFYTREEFSSNIASYKRYKLGVFPKGLNLGFVYIGNSTVSNGGFRFTTPWLNERVQDYTLTYQDDKKTFRIVDRHLANGYICHVTEGDFQGNILGMENRVVTESAKYDGDYNDILCMIESNPRTIAPGEEVEIGNSGNKDPEEIACKTSVGLYLFEDNYPYRGDFDFNDAVVQYEIRDYYQSKNRAKQITVQLMATGSHMSNSFGFRDSKGFQPFLSGLKGYRKRLCGAGFRTRRRACRANALRRRGPLSEKRIRSIISIRRASIRRSIPSAPHIPLSDPDDASWKFEWPQEMHSISCGHSNFHEASSGSESGMSGALGILRRIEARRIDIILRIRFSDRGPRRRKAFARQARRRVRKPAPHRRSDSPSGRKGTAGNPSNPGIRNCWTYAIRSPSAAR